MGDLEDLSLEDTGESAVNEAVELAHKLGGEGFEDMADEDAFELLDAAPESYTDDDIMKIVDHSPEEEEEPESLEDDAEDEGLSMQRLSSLIRSLQGIQAQVAAWDPDMTRALRFRNAIDLAIEPYRNELDQLKKQHRQLPITMFLDPIRTPRFLP